MITGLNYFSAYVNTVTYNTAYVNTVLLFNFIRRMEVIVYIVIVSQYPSHIYLGYWLKVYATVRKKFTFICRINIFEISRLLCNV